MGDARVERGDRARAAILRVLGEADGPLGASHIAAALQACGIVLQARTVRYYLQQLDDAGLTRLVTRRLGREITERGREEVTRSAAVERLGIVAARVDTFAYRMTFRPRDGSGTVVINRSLLSPSDLGGAMREMKAVFDAGFAIGRRLVVGQLGTRLGSLIVPEGRLAMGTICSVTLNGVLQKEGIPVVSRFGGLLEMKDGVPVRFINLIEYAGSTLDPLEVFIRADMTRVRSVVQRGTGILCASFREVPAAAVGHIRRVERSMKRHGLSGILAVGGANQPLFGIPVSEGCAGMAVVGGLNPVAAVHEAGIDISVQSLADLLDYAELSPIDDVFRKWAVGGGE
jgi:repressor of nif and glnA expression